MTQPAGITIPIPDQLFILAAVVSIMVAFSIGVWSVVKWVWGKIETQTKEDRLWREEQSRVQREFQDAQTKSLMDIIKEINGDRNTVMLDVVTAIRGFTNDLHSHDAQAKSIHGDTQTLLTVTDEIRQNTRRTDPVQQRRFP